MLQHKNLIRGKTYQIVNKQTEKTLSKGRFKEIINNYAIFDDFSIHLPSYYFIKVSDTRSNKTSKRRRTI